MDRADVRARIDEQWDALWATINSVPEARRCDSGAVGFWSVKDLLGHLAFWEAYSTQELVQHLHGSGEQLPDPDVEALNAREYELRRDWSWEHASSVLRSTHAELLALLPQLPERLEGELLELVAEDSYEHYEEHNADVTAWLARDTGSNA